MATVKPKMVNTFTITGDCVSHARTDVEVRDVDVTIDVFEVTPCNRAALWQLDKDPIDCLVANASGLTVVEQRGSTTGKDVGSPTAQAWNRERTERVEQFDTAGVNPSPGDVFAGRAKPDRRTIQCLLPSSAAACAEDRIFQGNQILVGPGDRPNGGRQRVVADGADQQITVGRECDRVNVLVVPAQANIASVQEP